MARWERWQMDRSSVTCMPSGRRFSCYLYRLFHYGRVLSSPISTPALTITLIMPHATDSSTSSQNASSQPTASVVSVSQVGHDLICQIAYRAASRGLKPRLTESWTALIYVDNPPRDGPDYRCKHGSFSSCHQ
jgi:hypothetical protein